MNKFIAILALLLNTLLAVGQQINFRDSMAYYYQKSNFETAIYWCKLNLQRNKAAITLNDSAYRASLIDLGILYRKINNYSEAEKTLLETIPVRENTQNADLVDAETLSALGSLYRDMGNYTKGEQSFKKAVAIYKQINKTSNQGYGITLNNLALLYQKTENFKASETLYNEALQIRKKQFGDTSKQYAVQLNNLAVLYYDLGNYEAAEPYYKEAVKIYRNKGDTTGANFRSLIQNLGTLYIKLNKLIEAENYLLTSLRFVKAIYGTQGAEYGLALHELGALYRFKKELTVSETYYKECLLVRKNALGITHPDYLTTLAQLGELYIAMHNYTRADSIFNLSLQLIQANFGKQNLLYLNTLVNKSTSKKNACDKSGAAENLQEQQEIERQLILNKLSFLSETELLAYLTSRKEAINSLYDITAFTRSNSNIISSYNLNLFLKGLAIQNFNSLLHQINTSSDSSIKALWKAYTDNKAQLNRLLVQPLAKRTMNADSFSAVINKQEKQLLDISAPYRNVNQRLSITWQDVQKALTPGSAAIEFIRYRHLDRDNNYVYHYAAMLLRKHDTAPLFIDLCNEDELLSAMKKFAYKTNSITNKSATKTTKNSLPAYMAAASKISRRMSYYLFLSRWLLYEISFAAIPTTANNLLADNYQLVQLTSTRQIAVPDINNKKPKTSFLFGGINYNQQSSDTTAKTPANPYAYMYPQNHRSLADSFTYLPGSLQEVNSIADKLKTANVTVYRYTGANASESNLRQACNNISPTIIHFATHGFALPDTTQQQGMNTTYTIAKNPLLRTGLVMAAGNKGWKGKNNIDEDDGILTGLEIAAMQLPNTQLAVLSACETANGEIRGSEGVFGLQRAFKLAGVNYIMASLWQVPDVQTKEFMNAFYKTWLKGTSIQDAFYHTQLAMRKKYNPYYWAGFTLVE